MAKRLGKEINYLRKNLANLTGEQAEVKEVIEPVSDEGPSVVMRLTPTIGYYKGDTIDFKLEFHEMYPTEPPIIICLSDIYHPNIDTSTMTESNVCLNLLDGEFWSPGFGIQGCVFGLLFLLENPNFDDPISPFFQLRDTMAEYVQDIANHRQGNKVGFMECQLDEVICSSCGQPNEKVDLPREIRFSHTHNVDITGETITALPDKETNTCSINCVRNLEPESVDGDQECKSSLSALHGNVLELSMTSETSPNCILGSLESRIYENKSETDTENALLLIDLKSKTGETKTKRQISEDNIVSASNKIFLKTSDEGLHHEVGKLRNDSVDEPPDFEEMLYIHFDMGTEIHTEK